MHFLGILRSKHLDKRQNSDCFFCFVLFLQQEDNNEVKQHSRGKEKKKYI